MIDFNGGGDAIGSTKGKKTKSSHSPQVIRKRPFWQSIETPWIIFWKRKKNWCQVPERCLKQIANQIRSQLKSLTKRYHWAYSSLGWVPICFQGTWSPNYTKVINIFLKATMLLRKCFYQLGHVSLPAAPQRAKPLIFFFFFFFFLCRNQTFRPSNWNLFFGALPDWQFGLMELVLDFTQYPLMQINLQWYLNLVLMWSMVNNKNQWETEKLDKNWVRNLEMLTLIADLGGMYIFGTCFDFLGNVRNLRAY